MVTLDKSGEGVCCRINIDESKRSSSAWDNIQVVSRLPGSQYFGLQCNRNRTFFILALPVCIYMHSGCIVSQANLYHGKALLSKAPAVSVTCLPVMCFTSKLPVNTHDQATDNIVNLPNRMQNGKNWEEVGEEL